MRTAGVIARHLSVKHTKPSTLLGRGSSGQESPDSGALQPVVPPPDPGRPAATEAIPTDPLSEVVGQLDQRTTREAKMTANEIVAAIDALGIYGDIVPTRWFSALAQPGKPRTVQDYIDVVVLAHIVAWYQPKGSKREKKFNGDRLILRRSTLVSALGCHKSAITRALGKLDALGLIHKKVEDRMLIVTPVIQAIRELVCKTTKPRNGSPTGVAGQQPELPTSNQSCPSATTKLPVSNGSSPSATVVADGLPLPNTPTKQTTTTPKTGQGLSQNNSGGRCPPSEVSPAATGGKPPGPPHTSNGKVQEPEVEGQPQNDTKDTSQADAEYVARCWPAVFSRLIGRKVVWPAEAMVVAAEFFEDNPDWWPEDVLWVAFRGYVAARDNPDEDQKLYNCRRYATSPQSMFILNKNNKFPVVRMAEELGYNLYDHPITEQGFWATVNKELLRLGKKPFEFDTQEEPAQPDAPPEVTAQHCIPVSGDDDAAAPELIGTAYRKSMQRLGLDLSLDRDAIRSAAELSRNDASYSSGDIVAICVLGAVAAVQNPPPPDPTPDPFLYCRNFSLSPKEFFGHNGAGDMRLLKMASEMNYEPLPPTDINEAIEEAIVTVQKNNWFGLLKDLVEWQEKQAEERRNDPRQYDLVDHFKCL